MSTITTILILGAGGREYAVAKALHGADTALFVFDRSFETTTTKTKPRPRPIWRFAKRIESEERMWALAKAGMFDMVFVGPEKYLAEGVVDRFEDEYNTRCIGPRKALAQLETSKAYARERVGTHGLNYHNPNYRVFNPGDEQAFHDYLAEHKPNVVVKGDGLHGGKGVWVCDDARTWHEGYDFGKRMLAQGEAVLVEERLRGDEFSLMTFTDGNTCQHMPPIQDFKRAYDGDKGPNTGSMGAITSVHPRRLPFLTDEDIKLCQSINADIILEKFEDDPDTQPYRGILYGSFMKVRQLKKGESSPIKIIEYNVRFGDPECIVALALLETKLVDVFKAIVKGTLCKQTLRWSSDACVIKYVVPNGYPAEPSVKEATLSLPPHFSPSYLENHPHLQAIYADFQMLGPCTGVSGRSRTVGLLCRSSVSTQAAASEVNAILEQVKGPVYYRRDIGLESNVYQLSGVNINEGNRVVTHIQKHVESTFDKHTISRFGDFSGLYALAGLGYKDPVLVTSIDGVGTKSLFVLKHYDPEVGYAMLGRDLVNHCVNDCLVKGARPLFFLDYFATRHIRSHHVGAFVKGIAKACRAAGCVLIGGETAEMPDVYANAEPNPYRDPGARLTIATDMVGTMVGVVERDQIIDGKTGIREGDVVLGLPSSGPHTNGYSLIRHITKHMTLTNEQIAQLAATHTSYLKDIHTLNKAGVAIHGLSHITGGGFEENVPRMMPDHLAVAWRSDFTFAPIFQFLQKQGHISDAEMRRVFNCGVGMVLIVPPQDVKVVHTLLPSVQTMGTVIVQK